MNTDILNINFDNMISLKNTIISNIQNGNLEKAEELLENYEKNFSFDLDYTTISAEIKISQGKLDEAENLLMNIYHKYEYNFNINALLGIIHNFKNNFNLSAKYFMKAKFLNKSISDDSINDMFYFVLKNISASEKELLTENIRKIISNSQKDYPYKDQYVENNEDEHIGNDTLQFSNINYIQGIYDNYYCERDLNFVDIPISLYKHFKVEIVPGNQFNKYEYTADCDCVIPIMVKDDNSLINFIINGEKIEFNTLIKNRFYYYPISQNDKILLKSNNSFIVGNIIKLKVDKNKPKLVLNIFIDGLSQKILEEFGLNNLMPYTNNFFKKGTICENTYVSGEWTYVGLASFFTGMYTSNHRVFHPEYDTDNIINRKLYSELFKENNYNTTKIDGDWRSNPAIGYAKGFNRTLYQPSFRGMHCTDVINETIEHIEAFKNTNNFIWICIPDLHDIADEYETSLSTQVNSSIHIRPTKKNNESSVRKTFDITKKERYKIQLKRIDTYLNLLFNYIEENFSNDEIIISLISDHGQGYFIENGGEMLDEKRVKVPLMIRGKDIKSGKCNEMIQGLDLFPIILKSANITDFNDRDGNLPKYFGGNKERQYCISETIFPDTPYKAVINDKEFSFYFESLENTNSDGMIKLRNYKVKLINKTTTENETNKHVELVKHYTNIILEHIKDYIIY